VQLSAGWLIETGAESAVQRKKLDFGRFFGSSQKAQPAAVFLPFLHLDRLKTLGRTRFSHERFGKF
jgi:hypothetical protein